GFIVSHVVATDARIVPIGNEERTVRRDANVRGAIPGIAAGKNIHDFGFVARALRLYGIGAHNARTGIGMDDLALKDFRQQIAFVNHNAAGRTGTGVQKIGNHAGIVLMPMVTPFFVVRNFRFGIGFLPGLIPACAGHLVRVAEVAKFHHVIDADAAITVVVVVGLPERPEGVDAYFVVVAEIMAEDFEFLAIEIAAEDQALP